MKGYDETWNSHIIASYLGRTRLHRADPVANRMHAVSDGLLAVSGIPPLEVARNFRSLQAGRFRNLAQRLMRDTPSEPELQEAISQINSEVRVFERRADRLASWKLGVVAAEFAAGGIEHMHGLYASVAAMWLYEQIKDRLPAGIRSELSDAEAMLAGLVLSPSLDAVVVSRARHALSGNRS